MLRWCYAWWLGIGRLIEYYHLFGCLTSFQHNFPMLSNQLIKWIKFPYKKHFQYVTHEPLLLVSYFSTELVNGVYDLLKWNNSLSGWPHQWLSSYALKLVDGRGQVQSPVELADLAVRNFPRFSPKLAWRRGRIP